MPASRLYTVTLPASAGSIACCTYLTDEECANYEASGYEVWLVLNRAPDWVLLAGFLPVWCFFQDLFNFRLGHYFKRNT